MDCLGLEQIAKVQDFIALIVIVIVLIGDAFVDDALNELDRQGADDDVRRRRRFGDVLGERRVELDRGLDRLVRVGEADYLAEIGARD